MIIHAAPFKRTVLIEKYPKGNITKLNMFLRFIGQIKIKSDEDRYTNRMFYFYDGGLLFYKNMKNGKCYCLDNFLVFYNFGFDSHSVYRADSDAYHFNEYLKKMTSKHFNVQFFGGCQFSAKTNILIERHFHNKELERLMKVYSTESDDINLENIYDITSTNNSYDLYNMVRKNINTSS